MDFVTVTAVSNALDKQERPYNLLTVVETPTLSVKQPDGSYKMALMPGKQTKFTAYPNNYLDRPDFAHDAEVGTLLAGSIVKRQVEAYEIPTDDGTRTVNTYSLFVPGDTSSPEFELTVRSMFKSAGHPVVAEEPTSAEAG